MTVTAEQLRDHGMQLALDVDPVDDAVVIQAIRSIGRVKGTVSANDVRHLLPRLASPNVVGACFRSLAMSGELEHAGYVRSDHAAGRCRPVALWRFVGPET